MGVLSSECSVATGCALPGLSYSGVVSFPPLLSYVCWVEGTDQSC